MTARDDAVHDLADRIADGEPIDWNRAAASEPTLLDALHTLDQVRSAYQRIGATAAPRTPPLFEWGSLSVLEKIGAGATAEVYRAWDPGLETIVALKLLRPEAAAAGLRSEEFLREGRLLAQISQRNVLRVYGAAVHDGRPGLWSEWIEGRTLDAIVAADGPLADAEAAYVGREVSAALVAIHAAGLLHGDVKASNVMRARGGRIVLTDLGAAGAPDAVNASLSTQATPTYLSPESRDGAVRGKADDLYALGVLLHFVLTGTYPRDGAIRVRDLKPEVSRGLADAIGRALDAQPAARFGDANAFADALRADVGSDNGTAARSRRRSLAIAVAAGVALAIGVGAWLFMSGGAWQPEIELLRRTDAGTQPLADGATLRAGDRIVLTVSAQRPTWVYVLNEDARGDFHVLFPVAGLELANPIAAGRTVTLPGLRGTQSLSWEVSGAGEREEFLVLLARARLDRLDSRLDALPAATVAETERGVVHTTPETPVAVRVEGEHLNAVLADLGEALADPSRARVRAWHFNDAGDAPAR